MNPKKNTCIRFATIMAKHNGMSYADATRKYPRGYEKNSVYINGYETHTSHCVHCARAETMSKKTEWTFYAEAKEVEK